MKLEKNQNDKVEGFNVNIYKYYFRQMVITSEIYRMMMVVAAFLVCLSHGSNDVANAISPLIVILKHSHKDDP